jgi:rubrerythrin
MDEELMGMLKEQRAFEQNTADSLTASVNRTKNSIVRLFLNRLVLDSLKHADLLQALIDLNTGAIVADIDKYRMKKELSKHILNEKEMLSRAQKIVSKVEDEKTRSLLQQIVEDEQRHHKILNELLRIIGTIENIRDEDWWELYYDRAEWLF